MSSENFRGSLPHAYNQLKKGTMFHSYDLTTERRTNLALRAEDFYTADGNLYCVERGKVLWGITREPQNLVLQNLAESCLDLSQGGNYRTESEEARVSLEHPDTVIIDLKGLDLIEILTPNLEYGYFVVDPTKPQNLNSQQSLAAKRIYGPDDDNYRKNLELFAQAGKEPKVFVLLPNYVWRLYSNYARQTLDHTVQYFARISLLDDFNVGSDFSAIFRGPKSNCTVRGERANISEQAAPNKSNLPSNDLVARLQGAFSDIDLPTLDLLERSYITYVLEKTGNNKTRTARDLGIDRRTLHRKIKRNKLKQ